MEVAKRNNKFETQQQGDTLYNSADEDEASKKLLALKRVILDCVGVVLQRFGFLKLEIQTITTPELLKQKKAICNALIEISKVSLSHGRDCVIILPLK